MGSISRGDSGKEQLFWSDGIDPARRRFSLGRNRTPHPRRQRRASGSGPGHLGARSGGLPGTWEQSASRKATGPKRRRPRPYRELDRPPRGLRVAALGARSSRLSLGARRRCALGDSGTSRFVCASRPARVLLARGPCGDLSVLAVTLADDPRRESWAGPFAPARSTFRGCSPASRSLAPLFEELGKPFSSVACRTSSVFSAC